MDPASLAAELGLPPIDQVGYVVRDLDKALYATDPLTGLIVAAALMHPGKKLDGVTAEFVLNRFKEKRFAAGANREQIATSSELGLELNDFVGIALSAMQGIGDELGL